MFKPHYGTGCPDCPPNTKALIVVKAGYCQRHNEERKKGKKALIKRVNEPKIEDAKEKLAKIIKSKGLKQKFKEPTGELKLFKMIWESRPHKCEVCGKEIKNFSHNIFSHILSKGSYGELRLDENNIWIMCFEFTADNGWQGCHLKWEHHTNDMKDDPMWKPVFELAEQLKQEANNKE